MPAQTIDEVLQQLQAIIDNSIKNNDRAGYFAALYYKVTDRVKQGIQSGQFDDGARMERLDVIFACRYLSAYQQWKSKQPVTGPWNVTFEAMQRSSPLVLQHLLLGMNAHINLDLGIATVAVSEGAGLQHCRNDFNSINAIISSLTYQVVGELNRISPLLSLMGLHATNYNSVLIQFSIENARDGAWCFAEELSRHSGTAYDTCITDRDASITQLAESIIHAKGLLKVTLWIIHLFEWKRPSKIIEALHDYRKTYIHTGQTASSAT